MAKLARIEYRDDTFVNATYLLDIPKDIPWKLVATIVNPIYDFDTLPRKLNGMVNEHELSWFVNDIRRVYVGVSNITEEGARLPTTALTLQRIFDTICDKFSEFHKLYLVCEKAFK